MTTKTTMDDGWDLRMDGLAGRLRLDRPSTQRERREAAALNRLSQPPVNHAVPPHQRTRLAAQVQPGWRLEAACASADPEAWFPEVGSKPVPAVTTTCVGCPVNRSCLAMALLWQVDGIWAATNPADRTAASRLLRTGTPVTVVLDELLTRPREVDGHRRLVSFHRGDAA